MEKEHVIGVVEHLENQQNMFVQNIPGNESMWSPGSGVPEPATYNLIQNFLSSIIINV